MNEYEDELYHYVQMSDGKWWKFKKDSEDEKMSFDRKKIKSSFSYKLGNFIFGRRTNV